MPATGELIEPLFVSVDRLTEPVRRLLVDRFASTLNRPVNPSDFGARPKSSTCVGVAMPLSTNAGIFDGSMLIPRVSFSFSNDPKKNARSRSIGPPAVPPH